MSIYNKTIHLIERFVFIWKNIGFKAALSKTESKIKGRFISLSKQENIDQVFEVNFQKIYNSYLSEGQNKKGPDYLPSPVVDFSNDELLIKLIAFYLPQFHPIPENDTWWGRGFTEWVNVSKAVPNFVGHYQPHLPGELGFYDLRVPEVQRRQVELAKNFGLYGFCFYYYWFNGKKLLEHPLEQFVSDKKIDFPFCLCWANENWTRRWDGLAEDILIAQDHSIESDFAFIRDIEEYFRNERYIRVNGRPVLLVYRPQILPDPANTAARWRQNCVETGIGEIYLIAVQSGDFTDPRPIGFDAAVEFPPHGIPNIPQINEQLKIVNPDFRGMVYDYNQAAEFVMKKNHPDYTWFRTVSPSWDNTARRQDQPLILNNATPENYQSWLTSASRYTLQHAGEGENFVFVNAWNEWAEGNHLEPDRKYGYAYLQATADAIDTIVKEKIRLSAVESRRALVDKIEKRHDTAVILHVYYPDLWEEIAAYLDNLDDDYDLYVSIPNNVKFSRDVVMQRNPHASIFQCTNRGRDIAPFLDLFSIIEKLDYRYICKIHTKKSVHREDGDTWRKEIFNELLGSSMEIEGIKQHLDRKDIGIIGPRSHLISTEYYMGGNKALIGELAKKLDVPYEGEYFTFIAGSMFWFKPSAISPVLDLRLNVDDFPLEMGQKDGTLAHAVERLICLIAKNKGYRIIETGTFSEIPDPNYNYAAPLRKDI
jgi:lipopolysaccharide biosynthesis protein